MGPRIAWVLNLDADIELATPGRYVPSARTLAAMRPHVETLASALLQPGETLLEALAREGGEQEILGRAFCPTTRAVAAMVESGAVPEKHPPMQVLRRVNSRAFSQSLGATLDGSGFFTTVLSARSALEGSPPIGDAWRVKHAFGMAGRNQRVVPPGTLEPADEAFVVRGVAHGGVQIEPNVAIERELARHGFLQRDGSLAVGALVYQRCDARGAWLSSERAPSSADGELSRVLGDEVERVARALHEALYFGPFGVDAFVFRRNGGHRSLQPRSEINARYSMGFSAGFGAPPTPLA